MARKGPRKFYVINEEDLDIDANYFKHNNPNYVKNQYRYEELIYNQSLRNYTLSPVFKAIEWDKLIDVFASTYVIGEHAQISWIDSENIWVFASRHSSIFLRSIEDMNVYLSSKGYLFEDPWNIASYWLKFYEENIVDKQTFIKELRGKTLWASFIDNSKYDSLLRYERPVLIFHSIVENEWTSTNWLSPDESYKFYK